MSKSRSILRAEKQLQNFGVHEIFSKKFEQPSKSYVNVTSVASNHDELDVILQGPSWKAEDIY